MEIGPTDPSASTSFAITSSKRKASPVCSEQSRIRDTAWTLTRRPRKAGRLRARSAASVQRSWTELLRCRLKRGSIEGNPLLRVSKRCATRADAARRCDWEAGECQARSPRSNLIPGSAVPSAAHRRGQVVPSLISDGAGAKVSANSRIDSAPVECYSHSS
jgi:hypothetical protein